MTNDDRHLDWEGCYNVRDLGGLPTENGRLTRKGQIIRADLLGRLTARGRRQLLDYGVRTVLDLRSPDEAAAEPSAVFENGAAAPRYLNLPQFEESPPVRALLNRAETVGELYDIILDHCSGNQAQIMRAIAGAPTGALTFHCHSGKDRTGIVAALLLSLAGVGDEAIAADYAASRERLWPAWEQMVAEAGGEDRISHWYKPVTAPETMLGMLARLREHHGGAEAYLSAAGLAPAEIAQIRSRLHP